MQIHLLQYLETKTTPSENDSSSSRTAATATMKKTILLVLLCAAVQEDLGGHIFVPLEKTWGQAQAYCRAKHVDLSYVGNQTDQDSLKAAAGGKWISGWIGLYRESSEWKWSGGEALTYEKWDDNQPDNNLWSEFVVEIKDNGKWNDQKRWFKRPFYCSTGSVRQVKKTWEEAQEHCRSTHSDLTSPHSETEVSWVLEEMRSNHITAPMWIGLRFLGDRWLWVDGDLLVYKPWSQVDQDYQCPVRSRCGALTGDGLWENRDCREKLQFLCK